MSSSAIVLLSLLVAVHVCIAEDIKQCVCDQFDPCYNKYHDKFMPCADTCAEHVAKVGNFAQMRKCIDDQKPKIDDVRKCIEGKMGKVCTDAPGPKVPKRFIETLKEAAIVEFHTLLTNPEHRTQIKETIKIVEKFGKCVHKCLDKEVDDCYNKLACGLKLPTDTEIVKTSRLCARQNHFDTKGMQELCKCMVAAGVTVLTDICSSVEV